MDDLSDIVQSIRRGNATINYCIDYLERGDVAEEVGKAIHETNTVQSLTLTCVEKTHLSLSGIHTLGTAIGSSGSILSLS